jgi:hypothetical protein
MQLFHVLFDFPGRDLLEGCTDENRALNRVAVVE